MKKRIVVALFFLIVIGLVHFSLLCADTLLEEHTIIEDTNGACAIVSADFNLDGIDDLVYTCFQSSHIKWLENDGNVNFTEHLVITGFGNAKAIDVGDLNQDGYPDFAATAYSGGKISWFQNDGTGVFTEHVITDTWSHPGWVLLTDGDTGTCVDINSDGEPDVLAIDCQAGRFGWFESDGNENFTEHLIKDNWYTVSGAVPWDPDEDNDTDILVAAHTGGIIWFENDGNENFTEHVIYTGWDHPNWIYAGDINGDGVVDFAATSCGTSDDVGWFENDGSQNFTLHTLNNDYDGARCPVLSDIDEDGDTDIFAIAWQGAIASFFENDGQANFTETVISTDALDLLKLVVVDLDMDDDLDIVGCTAVYGVHHIRWWENINEFLVADFTVDVMTGNLPLAVNFSESTFSKPAIQYWHWDFNNDGVIDSYEQNPEYTYNEAGSYLPTLEVSNGVMTETVTLDDSIRVFDGESALDFDSGNCVVFSPSATLNIVDDLTLEAWIKPNGWGLHPSLGFGRIVDKTAYVLMLIKEYALTNNYCLGLWLYNESGENSLVTTPDNSISLDSWQHVAASYCSTTGDVKMYIDGEEQILSNTNTPSGSLDDNSASDCAIGSTYYNCFTFNGTIDEVRIWNAVRSSEDIDSYKDYYLSGSESGLSGYWQMNEGTGILVHDSTPHYNDGVILDPIWTHGKALQPLSIDENESSSEFYFAKIQPNPCKNTVKISLINFVPYKREIKFPKKLK